jgi:hypothetical protein
MAAVPCRVKELFVALLNLSMKQPFLLWLTGWLEGGGDPRDFAIRAVLCPIVICYGEL